MNRLVWLIALLIAAPAQAQFKLPDLNINKLIDTAKGVVKATREIDENEEIAIGSDVAARLLGAARAAIAQREHLHPALAGRRLDARPAALAIERLYGSVLGQLRNGRRVGRRLALQLGGANDGRRLSMAEQREQQSEDKQSHVLRRGSKSSTSWARPFTL